MKVSRTKIYILLSAAIAVVAVGFWLSGFSKRTINLEGKNDKKIENLPVGSLRGESCENAKARPVAVMLASDPIARPLSGISRADIVIEMPVTPNGVTRLMAIFQCNGPEEIGSIRSAREDFLPLVAGFGAIYSHWGGEHAVLIKLDRGILDNLDALKNKYDEYFRKKSVGAPHNGFTSYEKLMEAARKNSYVLLDNFRGYPRKEGGEKKNLSQLISEITIDYEKPYNVLWKYDPENGSYKRFRNGLPEIDKIDGSQTRVENVVVIDTTSSPLRDQYININVVGKGGGKLYKGGVMRSLEWVKKDFLSRLSFYDQEGREIEFESGAIWIHYVTKK